MTESEALERLGAMVAASSVPTLDESEVDLILAGARRPDVDGLLPSDTGWIPTYDLNAAAAEGWRWKAGKVATDFTFSSDGQSFSRSDMVAACQDMARTYRDRVAGSIPLIDTTTGDTDLAGNVNA